MLRSTRRTREVHRLLHAVAFGAFAMTAGCKTGVSVRAEPPVPEGMATPPESITSVTGPSPVTSQASVVLVTVDGVRWQDVFQGADVSLAGDVDVGSFRDHLALVPNIHRLAEGGVALGDDAPGCGVVRAAGATNISLPAYFEIFAGRTTTCRSNACGKQDAPTILDVASMGANAASISSWQPLARAASIGTPNVLTSAGATAWPNAAAAPKLAELAENGSRAKPFPAPGGNYRPDVFTSAIALEYLATESPRMLHVGLGDPDEWGHRGDYASYLDALHEADAFIGDLVSVLESDGRMNATTIFVTTDHGRARNFRDHGSTAPESRRSFLVAVGRGISMPGTRCAKRDIELRDIAPTVRELLGLAPDTDPLAGRRIEEIVGAATPR